MPQWHQTIPPNRLNSPILWSMRNNKCLLRIPYQSSTPPLSTAPYLLKIFMMYDTPVNNNNTRSTEENISLLLLPHRNNW